MANPIKSIPGEITMKNSPKILKKPLSLKALKKQALNNRISVNIEISLTDMIDLNTFSLNDMADKLILKEGCLSDINYKIVGCIPAANKHNGYVILNVNADVSDLL